MASVPSPIDNPPATDSGDLPGTPHDGLEAEMDRDGTTAAAAMPSTSHAAAQSDPLSASWGNEPLSEAARKKVARILAACRDRDLEALSDLATSKGGLVEDEVRRAAWPILLACDHQPRPTSVDWSRLERHRDEDQVELDVHRSFVYYPENESRQRLDARKGELSNVITAVLRQHPILCYFQGYHDIVQVLLLVLGADAAVSAVARLSLLRIRDFMLPTLAAAECHLHLLPAILYSADKTLYQHLSGATQPTPFFALAATLTLYAHDIEEYGDIARLFDYLLASEAAVPVYLFAVIVISRKKELLEIDHDEPEMLHSILSKLPKPLDLEGLITRTQALFKQCPPERLPNRAWSRISSYSVLKTTRVPQALAAQTLEDGEKLFEKQASEIRRQEQLKLVRHRASALAYRYRRSVGWTSAAVLVALLALYYGRSGAAGNFDGWSTLASTVKYRMVEMARKISSAKWR
ncbi:TBC1 domain family member 20 [Lecanosticta acicola]|uniref:TBC1 domain family member 20 n=1 Tax=Lecanosticta acicola TaxID=111012 RepID=A0AAI9E7J5_9PEZI|nr:TBC1 domain family member 20 [Lecanosticta acicola]